MTAIKLESTLEEKNFAARSHRRTLGVIYLIFEIVALLIWGLLATHNNAWHFLLRDEKTVFLSLAFFVAFWVAYFAGSTWKIATLRIFLDCKTYRTTSEDEEEEKDPVKIKARSDAFLTRCSGSIASQAAFMAVISLFMWPVINSQIDLKATDIYSSLMQNVVIALGLTTILFMLWSIDLLDTAQNVFRGEDGETFKIRRYFFRQIGVFPRGGASYRYYGYATLTAFLICAVSFFKPFLCAPAVVFFCYLGYPVVFGYLVEYTGKEKKVSAAAIDPHALWPAVAIFFLGLAATFFYYLRA